MRSRKKNVGCGRQVLLKDPHGLIYEMNSPYNSLPPLLRLLIIVSLAFVTRILGRGESVASLTSLYVIAIITFS